MTRENKLALVVGFGLMLFVGILVSDHFSAQRFDPATVAQATPGDAITVIQLDEVGEQSLAPSLEPAPAPGPVELTLNGTSGIPGAPTPEELGVVAPAGPDGAVALTVETAREEGTPVRFYRIKSGDTFSSIAQREYGARSLGTALHAYNSAVAPDPARLALNAEIRLPPIEVLKPGATAVAAATTSGSAAKPAERPATASSYTVKKGDTAYAIARRSGVKVADLLRQNGIKDPAALRPGQTLNITVRR